MYNREFELDLISYCLNKPYYLKQHKERLESLKFSDKYLNLVYKELFKVLDSYKTIPTKTEFQKILNDSMSKNERFNDFEKEAVQEIITSIYDRYVTSLTGVSISNYLIKEETAKISEELINLQAQDLLDQIGSYERRLSKLRHFLSDDEDLGLNMFSDQGIAKAKNLLAEYNIEACIPTGYEIWDRQLQGGLRKGELFVVMASTGVGKAQPLNAKIVTPEGMKTMGDMKVGSEVIDWDGNVVKVKGVFPQGEKDIYKVTFSDGTSTECCDEHLWWVRHYSNTKKDEWTVLPLKSFKNKLTSGQGRKDWQIPNVKPINLPEKTYIIHPYVLGAILGDGSITGNNVGFTCADPELVENLRALIPEQIELVKHNTKADIDYQFSKRNDRRHPHVKNVYLEELRRLNLMGCNFHTKFIPEEYLWGSLEQRQALLQGLMDTDGHLSASKSGIDYISASLNLVTSVKQLALSLGGNVGEIKTKIVEGKTYYRLFFNIPICPFKLSRKAENWNPRTHYGYKRIIDKVEFVRKDQAQCIRVDSPTSSYLTDDFILTHNTAFLLNMAANMVNQDYRVVYVAMDNVEGELIARTVGCLMDRDITQKLDPNAAFDDVSDKYTKHYTNNFIIKHFAPRELTKSKLERYLDRLEIYLYDLDKKAGKPEDKCGKIDVLVLDYLECMLPESGAGEFWIAAEHLAQEVKAVLKTRDILGLTATQGGTEAMKSDTLKLHMAQGAKSRFNAPDLVFGVSQNEDEKKARPASKFRLSCLKARRAKTNYEIAFVFYKEKQVIKEDPV